MENISKYETVLRMYQIRIRYPLISSYVWLPLNSKYRVFCEGTNCFIA